MSVVKIFYLERDEGPNSELSGHGKVATGVEFENGLVIFTWDRERNTVRTTMDSVLRFQCGKGDTRVIEYPPGTTVELSWPEMIRRDTIEPCIFTVTLPPSADPKKEA
jgi:hypothetical protein